MTRPEILSGYVPTTVPALAAEVGTELPLATVIPTRVPFWIWQTLALLRAEGQITVEVVEIQLGADEVLRGQGGIPVSISGMDLPASATIAGRGRITAAASLVFSAAATLAGRGAVRALEAVMVLPGGSRLLEGRGQVSAAVQSILLGAGSRVLAGRGQITVSGVSQYLPYLPPPIFRMYKTNTQGGNGTSYSSLNGMVIDPAYGPATVANNVALEIPADLPAYTGTVRAEVYHTGGTSPRYGQTQITRNGSVVATGSQQSSSPGTSSAEWTGTVQGGDWYTIEWRGEGKFSSKPTAQPNSSFLRITPN